MYQREATKLLNLGPDFDQHMNVDWLKGNVKNVFIACLSQKKDCYCVMLDYGDKNTVRDGRICSRNVTTEDEARRIRDSLILLLQVHDIAVPVNKTPLTHEMLTIGCFGKVDSNAFDYNMTIMGAGRSFTVSFDIHTRSQVTWGA